MMSSLTDVCIILVLENLFISNKNYTVETNWFDSNNLKSDKVTVNKSLLIAKMHINSHTHYKTNPYLNYLFQTFRRPAISKLKRGAIIINNSNIFR